MGLSVFKMESMFVCLFVFSFVIVKLDVSFCINDCNCNVYKLNMGQPVSGSRNGSKVTKRNVRLTRHETAAPVCSLQQPAAGTLFCCKTSLKRGQN